MAFITLFSSREFFKNEMKEEGDSSEGDEFLISHFPRLLLRELLLDLTLTIAVPILYDEVI